MVKVRSALISVSDKTGVVELARALARTGTALYASGGTRQTLEAAGIRTIEAEKLSQAPEAFGGRMKTLSYPIFGGILFRRNDAGDVADAKRLGLVPVDCVVVNFYPFEKEPVIEQIDIGGPALVRAAAKNSPDVVVLTDPSQYGRVISELEANGGVSERTALESSAEAWSRILEYDRAIAGVYGSKKELRYGENPHQKAALKTALDSPIDWKNPLTAGELSYNNILDLSAAYRLLGDLAAFRPDDAHAVVVKHGNPCGAASVSKKEKNAAAVALELAWKGDPVSAFGGVVALSEPLDAAVTEFLLPYFIELVAAPALAAQSPELKRLIEKRKNLKAVSLKRVEPDRSTQTVSIVGGTLEQSGDCFTARESLRSVSRAPFPESLSELAQFGILVTKALKSNAVALVREVSGGNAFQLVGAGQGQPNRIDALMRLAVPRARAVMGETPAEWEKCVLVSDAFFPFSDAVKEAHAAGIRSIVQPGGSVKDDDSVRECDALGVRMAFSGTRHFRH